MFGMSGNSNKELFIRYVGNAVNNGEMDLADLLPSLTSLTELIQYVSQEELKSEKKLVVKITGVEKNSFGVAIAVANPTFLSNLIDNGNTDIGKLIVSILFQTTGTIGLFAFYKFTQNGGYQIISDEGDKVLVKNQANEQKMVNKISINLFNNFFARKTVNNVTNIINKIGYDKLEVQDEDRNILEEVDKKSVVYFDSKLDSNDLEVNIVTEYLQVDTLQNFSDKWKFRIGGDETIWAKLPEAFLNDYRLRKTTLEYGDILHAEIQVTKGIKDGKIYRENEIVKILGRRQSTKQDEVFDTHL